MPASTVPSLRNRLILGILLTLVLDPVDLCQPDWKEKWFGQANCTNEAGSNDTCEDASGNGTDSLTENVTAVSLDNATVENIPSEDLKEFPFVTLSDSVDEDTMAALQKSNISNITVAESKSNLPIKQATGNLELKIEGIGPIDSLKPAGGKIDKPENTSGTQDLNKNKTEKAVEPSDNQTPDYHTLENGVKEEPMIKNGVKGLLSGPEMYGLNDGLISDRIVETAGNLSEHEVPARKNIFNAVHVNYATLNKTSKPQFVESSDLLKMIDTDVLPKLNASIEKSIERSDLIQNENIDNGNVTQEKIKQLSQSMELNNTVETPDEFLKRVDKELTEKDGHNSSQENPYGYGMLGQSGYSVDSYQRMESYINDKDVNLVNPPEEDISFAKKQIKENAEKDLNSVLSEKIAADLTREMHKDSDSNLDKSKVLQSIKDGLNLSKGLKKTGVIRGSSSSEDSEKSSTSIGRSINYSLLQKDEPTRLPNSESNLHAVKEILKQQLKQIGNKNSEV